jgi:rod shape-determining protein MreD
MARRAASLHDLWPRLDALARAAFPATATLLGAILLALPQGLAGQSALSPAWLFAAVFFWSLYRPAALPPLVIFALGLFADLQGGGPIGLDAIVLLALGAATRRWRRGLAQQSFLLTWLAFAALAPSGMALSYALTALFTLTILPPIPAVAAAALAIGLYPLLALFLIRVHRGLAHGAPG